jgi:hypothetical protein
MPSVAFIASLMFSRRIAPLLFLGFLLPLASASVRRDDVSDSAYLNLGNRGQFRPVGRVEIDYGSGYEAIGTATLFGRDRIVSAAHVFDSDALAGAVGVRINFGRGRVSTVDFQTAGVVNINPRYNPNSLRNDVSVVFLSRSMNLAPARLYAGRRRVSLGTPITFVGYGDTGTGFTGSTRYSSLKRGAQNALDRYLMGGSDFEVDFDQPGNPSASSLGSHIPLTLEGLLGPGDSGGSVWVKRGRRWVVTGINSYGLDWNGNGVSDDYGDRSGFVYLPRYLRWMRSLGNPDGVVAERRVSAQLSAPQLAAVPEPGIVALLAIGGLVGGMALRRRR